MVLCRIDLTCQYRSGFFVNNINGVFMNLSLFKGGRPASVKNRAWHYCQMAWRGVCNQKALSRLAA
ncbi:pilin, partial [Escherichia coli]